MSTRQALLSGYQILTVDTVLDTATSKSLTVTCPVGQKVMGAGYSVLGKGGGFLDGRLTSFMPSADGQSWAVRATLSNPSGAPEWRLRVALSCADASALPGYEILFAEQTSNYSTDLYPECPNGKMPLGSGWSAVDASSSQVDVDTYLSFPINPYFVGSTGGSWRTNYDTWDNGKKAQLRTLCVSDSLPGLEIVQVTGAHFPSKTKQLYAACPAGKRAVSAGWYGEHFISSSCGPGCSYTNVSGHYSKPLHLMPNSEGTGWLVRSTDQGVYSQASDFDWRLNVLMVCVEADAPPTACAPTLDSLAFNAAGPTVWPSACWRPFATTDNPFVKLIPPEAKRKTHTNSANIVGQVLSQGRPEELLARKDGHAGEPVYYSRVTDPLYTISCSTCPLNGMTLHIPAGALPESGVASAGGDSGSDSHLTVIDLAGGFEYDFWQLQTAPLPASSANNPTPPNIVVSAGNRIALNSNGLYTYTNTSSASGGLGQNGTAAYYANSQGKIRLEELQSGSINHALFMLVYCHNNFEGPARSRNQNLGIVYPADALGRLCSGKIPEPGASNAPAMGAHFFYDKTPAEIDAMAIPAWKKTVLKALSQYGAFVGDTAGRWGFESEGSYGYFSATGGNGWERWFNYTATEPGWSLYTGSPQDPGERYKGRLWDVMGGSGAVQSDINDAAIINFASNLKVLQPCVSQGTCG